MSSDNWVCPYCGQTQDGAFFCNHCGKPNENDVINPALNKSSYNEIHELNELGQKTIKKLDSQGNTVSVTTFTDDNISEVIYDEKGNIILTEKLYSNTVSEITSYNKNGIKNYTYKIYEDRDVQINYDAKGNISSKIENYINGPNIEEKYNSDGKVVSITKKDDKNQINEEILLSYENGERKEATFNNGKLTSEKFFYSELDDDMRYSIDYEYDNGKVSKKTIHQKIVKDSIGENLVFSDLANTCNYTYDNDGKVNVKNTFYLDGKKIIEFNGADINVEYNDGAYFFTNNENNIYCEVDEFGNINYVNCDKDETLYLNRDGTFNLSTSNIVGNYYYDQNGNIICLFPNGDVYEYANTGQLLKEKIGDRIVEYDYDNRVETKTLNGFSEYRKLNHIEYNEEEYHALMATLVSVGQSAMSGIDAACSSVDAILNSMSPESYGGDTSGIRSAAQAQVDSINELNTTINYSLLAYDACDKELKDSVDKYIIDNLFDPNETNIEKYFKSNVDSHIEDRNSDGIYEYKKDTDFNELYEKAIPKSSYRDSDGNTLYFNVNNDLISAEGDNIQISYGKENFILSFAENGAIVLTDTDGKPLDIFGDYNISSNQFGGSQSDLRNVRLLEDKNIMQILDNYFQFSSYEEKEQLLEKAASKGCGYTAVTNAIFKEFEGKEDKFLDTFGFPMYNVKIDDNNNISVDYNYEPVILELFSELNGKDEIIGYGIAKGSGSDEQTYQGMREFIYNKYGVALGSNESKTPLFNSYGIFGDKYYKIYTMDGTLVYDATSRENGGPHAMTKLGETDDGKWIVSSWGKKLLCEINNPTGR